ncbi:glutaredoxin 2 [Micractinium conductrix]|uniref:Glutaredoxin-like protein n=1 Tax=Micractinium conductrix TaxID=554055 RepID=A0A2P6UZH3_9CHLO|nr:glutaredoxin 2 [Micractinium conductrix]|eukprot:PSC67204.1 glutaredoxin 2 [Micractinium conductrix]
MAAASSSVHRLAAQLAASTRRAAGSSPRTLASRKLPTSGVGTSSSGGTLAVAWQQLLRQQRARGKPRRASYSVITGGSSDGEPGSGSIQQQQPWRLIVYSKEGCHLCDGLKDKLEALLERAAFMPSAFSTAELEVRDVTSKPEWEQRYAMSIPVLAAAAADGSGEVEVPRPSPRFSTDALQKHIEKFLAKQPQLLKAQ